MINVKQKENFFFNYQLYTLHHINLWCISISYGSEESDMPSNLIFLSKYYLLAFKVSLPSYINLSEKLLLKINYFIPIN